MKILFLTSRYPFPPIGGDKLRAYHFIKHLAANGHEVHLLSLNDQQVQPSGLLKHEKIIFLSKEKSYFNSLRGIFSRKPLQVWYFRSTRLRDEIGRAVRDNSYDLIFCHLIRTAEYVRNVDTIPKIIDMTDAISLNYERISQRLKKDISFKNLIYLFEKKRVLRYEGEVIASFNKSILVSQVDRKYLGQFFNVSRVEVIPNGVDINYFSFSDGEYNPNQIVFSGNMRTIPNNDAAFYFAAEIFPLIKREVPEAQFLIVGDEPPKRILNLSKRNQDILVAGFVEDIRPYVGSSVVSVAPMRYGAGIQNKILESMAIGTPVVCSSIGLEGISANNEKEIIVEDSPDKFAKRVVNLMNDSNLRRSFSLAGRKLIENHYTWDKVLSKLDNIIEERKEVRAEDPYTMQ